MSCYVHTEEPWRIFWALITFLQGLIAVFCDLGSGYSNTSKSQAILIIYSLIISGLGTYQYLTNYFHFLCFNFLK